MNHHDLYQRWVEVQSHWDDEEYIGTLSSLQTLRYTRLNERVVAYLAQAVPQRNWKRPVLLDVGCGHAEFQKLLPSGWLYIGTDPSMEQLQHALEDSKGVRVLQGAAECLPLRGDSVHAVLLKEVLDHCWDPSKVFAEALRVLQPGGALVVTITNDKSWFKRLLPWVNRALKAKQNDHFHFFGPGELERLGHEARFDTVQVQTYNHLKLPGIFEKATGWLGEDFQRRLLGSTDALGRMLFPRLGGGMMLTARKPLEGGKSAIPPLENPVTLSSPVPSDLLDILVCPSCGSAIRPKGEDLECASCRRTFSVKEGIPSLLPETPKGN
jgi:SAM-dependent methyltransferase/uncharacterized protein YbaR (Trm112 family)